MYMRIYLKKVNVRRERQSRVVRLMILERILSTTVHYSTLNTPYVYRIIVHIKQIRGNLGNIKLKI